MLLCCLLPVFAVGALLLWRPQWNGYGVGLLVWFCFASLPANMARYDALAFFNEYLALLLSMVLATVAARVILPPNRPWMWKRLEHDLRERVVFAISGKSKGLVSGFESGTRDLLNQAYTFSAGRPDVQRRLLGWMFLVLEVGQAIIELRLEQQRLPQEPCYAERTAWRRAIRLMGRALIRLFLQPGPSNRQRALHAVNQAIMAVRAAPEPRAPQFDTSPLRRCSATCTSFAAPCSTRNRPWARKETREPVESRGAEGHRDIVTDPYKVLVLTESICRSLSQLKINPTAEVNSR